MERIISKDDYGNIACNNIIICSISTANLERNIKDFSNSNWKVINPKYYRYLDDNCLIEVWEKGKGIVLDNGLCSALKVGYIADCWADERREEITYEKAMSILDKEENKNETNERKFPFWLKVISGHERPIGTIIYVENELTRYKKEDVELYTGYIPSFTENKDLMSREMTNNEDLIDAIAYCYYRTNEPTGWEKLNYQLGGIKKQSKQKDYILEDDKQNNNGGASDWYALPKDANTLQDLIEHRNMNGSVKDIFKACYRLGIKTEDELRDLNKMAYYSLREVGRISGRKDYITIAKELIDSQAIENE